MLVLHAPRSISNAVARRRARKAGSSEVHTLSVLERRGKCYASARCRSAVRAHARERMPACSPLPPLLLTAPDCSVGAKTEHYTTTVQYDLKTSLHVRLPAAVATGTSPRAPAGAHAGSSHGMSPHGVAGHETKGGYISPYKAPSHLDALGKLSQEGPAPWDYAEAQVSSFVQKSAVAVTSTGHHDCRKTDPRGDYSPAWFAAGSRMLG